MYAAGDAIVLVRLYDLALSRLCEHRRIATDCGVGEEKSGTFSSGKKQQQVEFARLVKLNFERLVADGSQPNEAAAKAVNLARETLEKNI